MRDRYPGYDVLNKRHTPSWNEVTRRVIDQRLSISREPNFFTEDEWLTINAICDRIVPQPKDRPPIPVAALVDEKMAKNRTDGYRHHRLPKMQDAWRRGLRALDQEAQARHGGRFHAISVAEQNALLQQMQKGALDNPAWDGMPCKVFFSERMAHDIVAAYYAHPTAWNEIGFGGPASPRGYVRMGFDKRDPWEAAEEKPGREDDTRRRNRHVG
jgi:gluconate 2-dehydrogenase subunit 3-like protein